MNVDIIQMTNVTVAVSRQAWALLTKSSRVHDYINHEQVQLQGFASSSHVDEPAIHFRHRVDCVCVYTRVHNNISCTKNAFTYDTIRDEYLAKLQARS